MAVRIPQSIIQGYYSNSGFSNTHYWKALTEIPEALSYRLLKYSHKYRWNAHTYLLTFYLSYLWNNNFTTKKVKTQINDANTYTVDTWKQENNVSLILGWKPKTKDMSSNEF